MKNKKVLAAIAVALAAGVLLNGESCRRVYRDGLFTDSACTDGALLITRAFVPGVFDGSDIGAALAPIDSPLKAALVASIERGISLGCERAVRQVDTGYEVQLTSGDCRDLREEVIRVEVNGYLMVISTEAGPGQVCVGSHQPPLPSRSTARAIVS